MGPTSLMCIPLMRSLSQGFQHQFFSFTKNRSLIVHLYVKSSTYKREMVSGRHTCKVQAHNQCNTADTQSEASRRDYC